MPVRCNTCGRAGLPVLPLSKGGSGELAHPVAHVRPYSPTDDALPPITEPCLQGVSRLELASCVDNPKHASAINLVKREIWNSTWELDEQ